MSSNSKRKMTGSLSEMAPAKPPEHLTEEEAKHYTRLRNEYLKNGAGQIAGTSALVAAATAAATLDFCRGEVVGVPSTFMTPNGPRVHPAHKELRAATRDYLYALTVLGITPRSRSAARVTKSDMEAHADRMASEEDPILKLCQG